MKKKQLIIGIDISKDTLDVFLRSIDFHFVVDNTPEGFVVLLETACKKGNCKITNLFICFENTGKYSKMLSVFLHTQEITFVMSPALAIKKSLGITRGKNDKVDAIRIANYVFEKKDSLVPTVLPGAKIDKMKTSLSLREKLVKHRTAYKNGITDLNDCYEDGETDMLRDIQEQLIAELDKKIEYIENEICLIIQSDEAMSKNYKLILSVRAIGKINAFYFIAFTANFTLFANSRAYACFAGIAPFAYSSGTVTGKDKVHHYANKQLKALLNMAARTAVKCKGEFKQYYDKRTNDFGKNKMSSLNIIRNKLVARVFAVVNRGTPYVDLHKFAT